MHYHLSGDDTFFIDDIDFPIPVEKIGIGVRFSLSDAFEYGTSPIIYTNDDVFNPSSSFHLES